MFSLINNTIKIGFKFNDGYYYHKPNLVLLIQQPQIPFEDCEFKKVKKSQNPKSVLGY
jgi:hypothetical protein